MNNEYRVQATVSFTVRADNRAAAHVVAVDALTAAELPRFDLASLNIAQAASDQPAAKPAEAFGAIGRAVLAPNAPRPDFSGLDPTPLDEATIPGINGEPPLHIEGRLA